MLLAAAGFKSKRRSEGAFEDVECGSRPIGSDYWLIIIPPSLVIHPRCSETAAVRPAARGRRHGNPFSAALPDEEEKPGVRYGGLAALP